MNDYDEHEPSYEVTLNYEGIATMFVLPFYYSETPVEELQSRVAEWVKLGWIIN